MTRTKAEEEELARLIHEQELDARYGDVVRSSHLSLEAIQANDGQTTLGDFLDADGRFHRRRAVTKRCPVHDTAYVFRPNGWFGCASCDKERQRTNRRLLGIQPRPEGSSCVFLPGNERWVSGRLRCAHCLRAADKRRYWRKKMQIRKTEEYEGQCACGARFRNLNVDMVIQEFQIHLDTEAHEHNALAAIEREEEGSF